MNPGPNSNTPFNKHGFTLIGIAISLVTLAIFAWFYFYEPLAELPIPKSAFWNDKVQDLFYAIPAIAAAILATVLTRHFEPSEPPRRIWLNFTLAWWWWVGAELLGMAYDFWYFESGYPDLTLIDLFWVVGYVFFGLSLYYQFRLIYSWKQGRKSMQFLYYSGAALTVTFSLTQWALAAGLGEGISWLALYVAVLYPVFDIVEGIAALWLFFLFGRGYLGRPWWGLVAFAIADGIGTFLWIGGLDWASDQIYNIVDLIAAVTYLGGYLITVLALMSAIRHIERGRIITKSASPASTRD